jgi:glycine dehydrogenase
MNNEHFAFRHTGPQPDEIPSMLEKIGVASLDELIDKTIPSNIRLKDELKLDPGISEAEFLERIREMDSSNKIFKTYIGMGYYGTIPPAVIVRNILENPAWYTSYTPYQAEISQGRLEALLNFQTAILELTQMDIANASLLDEGTAAAEAMIMFYNARPKDQIGSGFNKFLVEENIFPQTLEVVKTRAGALGIEIITGNSDRLENTPGIFGMLLQYPAGDGKVTSYRGVVEKAHAQNIQVAVAADIMSLVMLEAPGAWGADVALGSTQRFGIPMYYGGPHAAYFAVREAYKRFMPGRIIGITVDREGRKAFRMALQTREQHIKRERATSNICTAQALLATMAGMYAICHGYEGLRSIALRIHRMAVALRDSLAALGYHEINEDFFDTLCIRKPENLADIQRLALERQINLRYFSNGNVGISMDETTGMANLNALVEVFAEAAKKAPSRVHTIEGTNTGLNPGMLRTDHFMNFELFRKYRNETELMRYIKLLERKDYSLVHGMIPLGSCTMKLNAAAEMFALSFPGFGNLHPFVPVEQAPGYHRLFQELSDFLRIITGLEAVSFQPNSGAAGEYAGLMVIRKYLQSRNEGNRNVVLIPASAHGTNPASAAMAGLKVVVVDCDEQGNIKFSDLKAKAELHKSDLAAFMVTYPSTHGVFESAIKEMADLIHQCGGQVYMDGANMNAQVGLTNPASIGADICHLNLHKTFAIPHGGGGPGEGPIVAAKHLAPFLPSHPVVQTSGSQGITAVSSAPWGSAGILCISFAYCCMLGKEGLAYATKIAILNANYLAACLKDYYKVLYTGENGFVGHEMILDCRNFKPVSDITETDIAKRLMDYGFHAPTLSFPVHGTLMVEPTESEPLSELNRFIEALVCIHQEIAAVVETGNKTDNVLKNAPHTQLNLASDEWNHPYSRKQAAFPVTWCENNKFWPAINRVDDAFGDRNLVCTCAPVEE